MPNKLQNIIELSKNATIEISKYLDLWMEFLNTASNNYKYSFNDQVLIFVQKPEATACADIEIWNKKLHRWIKKGSKGIALIKNNGNGNQLRHVFDVSDTYDIYGRQIKLWQVNHTFDNEIIESLENRFGTLDIKDNLANAIISTAYNAVEDNLQDYLKQILDYKVGSSLEKIDNETIEFNSKLLITNSVAFIMLNRCGYNPLEYFNKKDFDNIVNFDTIETISRIGNATRDIAEVALQEIYLTNLNLQKSIRNTNHTFEKNKPKDYYKDNEENIERRNLYGENNISYRRRLSDTGFELTKTGEDKFGELRKNEMKLPKAPQQRSLYGTYDQRRTNESFTRSRESSTKEVGSDNTTISEEKQSKRRNERKRSDEMGWTNEQLQNNSGGNNSSGNNLQLNLFTNNLSVEEQINWINEAEVENTPAFSFNQNLIDDVLLEGSYFTNGKFRIYRLFKESYSTDDNIAFLKKEYGEGGGSVYKHDNLFEWHSAKGIKLSYGLKDNAPELFLTWNKVEKRLKELVNTDTYLNNEEKEKYQKWLNEEYESEKWMYEQRINPKKSTVLSEEKAQNNLDIEKNYKLSNDQYFHFHTSEEGYYYSIYDKYGNEQDGGLLEYSENEETQTLSSIRKRLADFTNIEELSNENLEEVSQDFIDNLANNEIQNATTKENYIEQAQNVLNLFETREEKGEALNREEYYEEKNKQKEKNSLEKINYHIDNNFLGEGTPKEKVAKNIEAIKILKKLEQENKLANKDEQEVLAQYVGWGGLPDVFDEKKSNWSEEYNILKQLLTKEEYESARASTLTAFYTPPVVIRNIYKALQNMGLKQANILEPSCRCRKFYRNATRRIR